MTRVEVVRAYPPVSLTAEVPVPAFTARTNGGLADAYVEVVTALRRANAQLASLRSWSEEETEE